MKGRLMVGQVWVEDLRFGVSSVMEGGQWVVMLRSLLQGDPVRH